MSFVDSSIKKPDLPIRIIEGPSEEEIFSSLRDSLPLKLKSDGGYIFDASIIGMFRKGGGIWDVSGNIKDLQSKVGQFFRGNGNFEATFYTSCEDRHGKLYFHLK